MSIYIPKPTAGKPRNRAAKTPKYRNKKVTLRGDEFDSVGERDRWLFLKLEQERGEIRHLYRQFKYPLTINGQLICHYIADFVYERLVGDEWVNTVEDFKGVETDVFKLKFKMMKACHGITIEITKRLSWRTSNALEGKSYKCKSSKANGRPTSKPSSKSSRLPRTKA